MISRAYKAYPASFGGGFGFYPENLFTTPSGRWLLAVGVGVIAVIGITIWAVTRK